ncbi:MAG: HEPN domain-containing protein [Candidatus Thermoplasmatota archaeon]|nr:HEPN domain-containing protein [Candidatus Thermoplasmatota archaeon]
MGIDEEVLEYYRLSQTYLKASLELFEEDLLEPTLFNAIHALELGIKAALFRKMSGVLLIHNVGGLFGREFRETIGNDVCKEINQILSLYNFPRYPGMAAVEREEVEKILLFIEEFLENTLPSLVEKH